MDHRRSLGLVGCALLMMLTAGVSAQVTTLRPVPSSVGDQVRERLVTECQRLKVELQALTRADADFRTSCRDVPDPSPQVARCRDRQMNMELQRRNYNEGADRYNGGVVMALDDRISELRAAIARDQAAIRNLGIHRNAAEFDNWANYAAAADRERLEQTDAACRDALSALAGFTIQTAITRGFQTPAVRSALASFKPADANRIVRGLRDAGVDAPDLFASIRAFARASTGEKAAAATEMLRRLRQAKSIWDLHDLGPNQESAKWKAGAAVLGIVVADPRLQLIGKLTLAEVRASFYAVSENLELRLSNGQIDRLTALTEQQLINLKGLSAQLQADVDRLNDAKAERASL